MLQDKRLKWVAGLLLIGLFGLLFISCARPEPRTAPAASQAAPAPPPPEPPAPAMPANPYDVELKPLSPAQCGQCHPKIFLALKNAGGKHRFNCQECHQLFHVVNKQEAMPKCANCHQLPHGEPFADCLACHVDPHAPRQVPLNARVTGNCGQCHGGPAGELRDEPSAHTEQACQDCHHDRHGYIPSCLECHEPHYGGQPAGDCLGCHPPHKPLRITLTPQTEPRTCGACHSAVYDTWTATPSRHGKVNCTRCHTQHGLIPACTTCHPQPHSERMLAKYPKCLTCHLDAHNPPVKNKQ